MQIKEDETRILTPLGREQAHLTGKRIAEMIQGAEETFGSPCRVKALRVSNLTRAKETADIIALYLPSTVSVIEPDPMLNEGRPCHTIPGGRMSQKDIETTDAHHPRIEGAFRKYVHRAPEPLPVSHDQEVTTPQQQQQQPESKHEFEIIVCHANVIRYIMCRYVLVYGLLFLEPKENTNACTVVVVVTHTHFYFLFLQCIAITPRGMVTILSIQLQLNVPDHTSHRYGELSYDW
jgi:broad specificity phosphatase PhoE